MRNIFILLACLPFFASAQTCEPNMDFELGTYSGWRYYIGSCCPGGAIAANTLVGTPPASTLIPCAFSLTGSPGITGTDRYGGFPVVGPGLHSLKIGSERINKWAEKAEYLVHVPAGSNDYSLFYNYAVVMEDPSHGVNDQPRFTVTTRDSATGALIPCGNYSYVSGSLPGWMGPVGPLSGPAGSCGGGGSDVYYKPWSIASINLTGYAGRTVIVSFAAGGCNIGGHFGYAYVEMSCGLFAITHISTCSSPTVQLSAPLGFASYAWYDSTTYTTFYGANDTINVPMPTTPTTYAVIVSPYPGYGCADTLFTTVYPPVPINGGSSTICQGSNIALSSGSIGGLWSSDNPAVATVSSSGTVTGVSGGTTIISYTSPSCSDYTKTITVQSVPSITGNLNVCVGYITTLSTSTTGGVWSSSNPTVATISAAGAITGVSPGSATISYTMSSGCAATALVNITAIPTAITAPAAVCQATTATLSCSPSSGMWSSSNSAVAVISPSGVLTASAPGITVISYTMPGGCATSTSVTILQTPTVISGPHTLCQGASLQLSSSPAGGTWSSSNIGVTTISTTGFVTSIATGAATISYTLATGCAVAGVINVAAMPTAITGPGIICQGATVLLSCSPGGGVWSSSNITVASVSPSGMLTATTTGTALISYTIGSCAVSRSLTVMPMPTAISGPGVVCQGDAIAISCTPGGGTWSSSNAAVASVSAGGTVTGMAAGTALMSYAMAGNCVATSTITVIPTPTPITGPTLLCLGTLTMLNCTPTGGVWSSSNSAIATIDPATGWISGVSPGITTITYTVGGTCSTTINIDVSTNVAPPPITGDLLLCIGETTTLSNPLTGGTWSSDDPSKVTITMGPVGGGVVTALAPGSTFINHYNGCPSVVMITVEPNPTITADETTICPGNTTTLSSSPSGGSWTSGNMAVATVSATGTVGGVSTGSSTMTYTTITGCTNTQAITVITCPVLGINGLPADVEVTIFPNPAKSTLTVTCNKRIGSLEITNMPGQVVYTNNYTTDQVTVDLAALPKGVYILRINGSVVKRLVKE